MRFYVHDVRFHAASGESVALALEPDGQWQHEEVALLDFEDGTGDCDNGTEETRTFIRGTLPPGDYTGLSFILGVPEALNHIDVATAPAPLNVTKLFWSWTGGYKFLRLDVRSDGQPTGWNVHIGSAKCTGGGAAGPATCELGNRVPVTLDRFDADTDAVVLDVLELFAANDLDVNDAPSAGCMTALDDADCEGIFGQLGLTLDGAEGDPQAVFEARGR